MTPFVAVISAGRSQNVPAMLELLGDVPHTWVVPFGQEADYEYAGAPRIRRVASTQDTHQRNFALRCAGDRVCVQLDDDLKRLQWVEPGGKPRPIAIAAAIELLEQALTDCGAAYAGVAPTDNPYFTRHQYQQQGFIRSAFIAVQPENIYFDDLLPLKADYDFTLQQLRRHGRVARADGLLATFDYGQGSGGCVAYRTSELEQRCIAYLKHKWPGKIVDNPKRPNEVLLRWGVPNETAGMFA